MDFNDITTRIKRLYASIDFIYTDEVISNTKIERKIDDNSFHMRVSFGSSSEDENMGKVMNVIHNLANLKDNLKNKLSSMQLDPRLVETEIDNSFYLQLIIDLSNQDKHGYPLTKRSRSLKSPLIRKIRSFLRSSVDLDNNSAGILGFPSGQVFLAGYNKIVIDAEITDENGNLLCSLDDLITQATAQWENFIKTNNCV